MRAPRFAVAALVALSGLAGLQAPARSGEGTEAEAKVDWAAKFKALNDEYAKAEAEFFRPWREAKTDEERKKLGNPDPAKMPVIEYLPKFTEIAVGAKGTAPGLQACAWLLGRGSRTPDGKRVASDAIDLMTKDGVDCPELAGLVMSIRYASGRVGEERVAEALKTVAEKTAVPDNRGCALTALAAMWNDSAQAPAERKAEAKRMLAEVIEKHGKCPAAPQARGILNELEHLQVGMTAPDFDATDGDGVKFKLSDYRGRVVVLDFWGFW